MICTLTFNPSLDCFFDGEISLNALNKFPQRITFGGKGINVSACLNALEVKNIALGFCAGFSGAWLIDLLNKNNIANDFVFLNNGFTRINAKAGATEINAVGPIVSPDDFNKLIKKLENINFDTLVLSGSAPNGIDEAYKRICEKFKSKRLIIDTTGNSLKDALKFKPYLIKPNIYELGELFNKQLKTDEEIIFYSNELIKLGAQNVLVSCGKDGLIFVGNDKKTLKARTIKGKVLSAVACGDCTVAGFLAGNNLDESFLLASACGNACALSGGIPDKNKILDTKSKLNVIKIQ